MGLLRTMVRWSLRGSAVALAILFAACSRDLVEPDLVIDGVTVIDGTGRSSLPDRSVSISDGRITGIGPAGRYRTGSRTVRIDARGKFLIPGLWDMHVHLMGYGERSFPLFLANGVTTIRDMGGDLATPRAAIEAGQRTIEHHWQLALATSDRGEAIAGWELAALQ